MYVHACTHVHREILLHVLVLSSSIIHVQLIPNIIIALCDSLSLSPLSLCNVNHTLLLVHICIFLTVDWDIFAGKIFRL